MSRAAEILKKLHKAGRVTEDGLRKAVEDGVITETEMNGILNGERNGVDDG